jgi:anti-sigma B factor antagonist
MSRLNVRTSHHGRVIVMTVAGELDIASVDELAEAANRLASTSFDQLVLDLRPLQFLDSTGLRTLLTIQRDMEKAGRRLAFTRGSRVFDRLLAIVELRDHFAFVDPDDDDQHAAVLPPS